MANGTITLVEGLSGKLSPVGSLTGTLSEVVKLTGSISRPETYYDYYEGAYQVTPSAEAQMLQTSGKCLTGNVVVNPIPNNYGLITWNGSTLTVS